jgi:hypothetical protein
MTIPARPSLEHARPAEQRPDVGRTAFGLAALLLLVLPFGMLLVNLPGLDGQGPAVATTLWLVQSSGMILAFLLGLAAVITGRGRGWGIGAMAIGLLGNSYVWLLASTWLGSPAA